MPKGRIALFVSSFDAGGVQRVMINLANELTKQGYPVEMVAVTNRGPLEKTINPGVEIKNLDSKRVLFALKGLVRYFKSEQPHVFVSGQTHLNVIAALAHKIVGSGSKLIVVEHNHMSSVSKRGKNRVENLRPLWAKLFYRYASKIVAVSEDVATDLAELSGINRGKIRVVYNPVFDNKIFKLQDIPIKHPWFLDTSSPIVLGVGRLSAQKDFSSLILAIAEVNKIKPVRLLILGEGEEREKLEALVQMLALDQKVALPGYVENPFAYMKNADLFVLSSAWEGLPSVLIEAMACGTAVLSTDCPAGPREILEDGKYGNLVPVGDVHALAAGILESLANPRKPKDLIKRARHFLSSEAVNGYIALFND